MRLRIEPELDYAASLVGLARSIHEDIARDDRTWPVRKTAELVARFRQADPDTRRRMITAEPPGTGDQRWDAFVAAVAEWLAVQHGLEVPGWAYNRNRYLRRGWWITPMVSMRAWEYAGSPASFKNRGVYVHRESLANVQVHAVLTRERILALFAELNDDLCRSGIRGDIFIVGGAAMTLAYDARPATRDVDGI